MSKNHKQTVVFDLDGVIHSYTSGWQGTVNIFDPPVDGIKDAIAELRESGYEAIVVSARCASEEGRQAVQDYLEKNDIQVDAVMAEKPPALCYIDDRALKFDGDATSLVEKVKNFKTWRETGQIQEKKDSPAELLKRFVLTHCNDANCEDCELGKWRFCVAKEYIEQDEEIRRIEREDA